MTKPSLITHFTKENLATAFVFFLTLYLGWLLFSILSPYFWAFFFALLFYIGTREYFQLLSEFLQKKIKKSISQHLAAIITILCLLFLIIFPSVFILRHLTNDAAVSIKHINSYLQNNTLEDILAQVPFLQPNSEWTAYFGQMIQDNIFLTLEKYSSVLALDSLQEYSTQILKYIQNAFQATFGITTSLLFVILITYFLLVDEVKIFQVLCRNLPFSKKNLRSTLHTTYQLVLNILKGNLTIAVLLASYMIVGFWICQITNPIFWGALAGIATLLPVVGSSIIWIPIALYLILIMNMLSWGVFLLIYGFLGFAFIEIILKPKVLNSSLKIHPLLIFFSLLGGILKFGLIGVVIGPLIISLFMILWRFNPAWR